MAQECESTLEGPIPKTGLFGQRSNLKQNPEQIDSDRLRLVLKICWRSSKNCHTKLPDTLQVFGIANNVFAYHLQEKKSWRLAFSG